MPAPKPTAEEIRSRFVTTAPAHEVGQAMADSREAYADFAQHVVETTASSREQSLALTALEEAKYWTNQALIRHGIQE